MTVYSGVLEEVSRGVEDLRGGSARIVQLDFVKIGNERIRNIYLTGYVSNFLRTGETLKISGFSFFGKFILAAIRRSDGEVVSTPLSEIMGPLATVMMLILWLVFAGFIGLIFGKVGFVVTLAALLYITFSPAIKYKASIAEAKLA